LNILVGIELEMLREDDRREVGRRAVAADTDSLSFQLFEPRDSGWAKLSNRNKFPPRQSARGQSRQAGLNNLTDAHQRRIAAANA